MKMISLTQWRFAMVDDEDFERVSQYSWHAAKSRKRWEARRMLPGKPRRIQRLHHFIFGKEIELDHKDGNPLNNTRENLRPATRTQNMHNRGLRPHSSRFKGVWRQGGKFMAAIRLNKKLKHLGRFAVEEEAGKAYDAAAIAHFGEFAKTNQQLGSLPVGE